MAADLKLTGALVIDGSGAPARRADVAVERGVVAALGDLAGLEAARSLDCAGRVVTPGFIDIHSHADWLVPGADAGTRVEPFLRQGMTTLVGGNCGFSPAPVSERSRGAARASSRLIADEELEPRWATMEEFLDGLDASGLPLNVAELVGHGAIRSAVMGPLDDSAPTEEQHRAMERLAREALDAGCVGVSTGLGYAPGIFAGEEELARVAGWAGAAGTLFTSHVRAYSRVSPVYRSDPAVTAHNVEALQEVMRAARAGGARLQLSHLIFVGRRTWDTCGQALAAIEAERARGLDVAFDAFPYTAGNTTAAVLFPPEMLPHLESILKDPEALAGIRALGRRVFEEIGFFLEDVQIMRAGAPAFDDCDGLFVGEAAARKGLDVWEFYARLVVESRRSARVLNHTYSGHDGEEEALRRVLAHPLCTIETDTFLTGTGHQNPASYGTFPRVLSTYVKAGLFPLEEGVRKMTGAAAERLGLRGRGLLRPGQAADLVVLDPKALQDRASFAEPARFPDGIEHVFVNGVHVVDGARYDARAAAGRVLRV
jgi:N-acyl-D-amino-acid deacylase